MKNDKQKDKSETPTRLINGEAYMYCSDCNAKLWSFDGNEDKSRVCPYPNECGGN